jgi:hypothetical protein
VDPRAGLDDVEKKKFLTLPGLQLQPICRPARSQSLYRLSYPGSCLIRYLSEIFFLTKFQCDFSKLPKFGFLEIALRFTWIISCVMICLSSLYLLTVSSYTDGHQSAVTPYICLRGTQVKKERKSILMLK